MDYPALSDIWELDRALNPKAKKAKITAGDYSRALFKTSQIFPLRLFPDQLIIEELRIIHVKKLGPWSDEVISIMATDIASVNAAAGLIFGHIHIQSLTGGREIMVDDLLRNDVYKARSLVEGIAMSAREGLRVKDDNLEREVENLYKAGEVN